MLSGQIWKYGKQKYFIQVSPCEWLQFESNNYKGKFNFVDSSEQDVLHLSNKIQRVQIAEFSATIVNIEDNQVFEVKGKWTFPSKKCAYSQKGKI